jgi:hypothetical protein
MNTRRSDRVCLDERDGDLTHPTHVRPLYTLARHPSLLRAHGDSRVPPAGISRVASAREMDVLRAWRAPVRRPLLSVAGRIPVPGPAVAEQATAALALRSVLQRLDDASLHARCDHTRSRSAPAARDRAVRKRCSRTSGRADGEDASRLGTGLSPRRGPSRLRGPVCAGRAPHAHAGRSAPAALEPASPRSTRPYIPVARTVPACDRDAPRLDAAPRRAEATSREDRAVTGRLGSA